MEEKVLDGDKRIICNPSAFAKQALFYVQETGSLKGVDSKGTSREHLNSFLFVIVRSGKGILEYEGETYSLEAGQCFFIHCMIPHKYHGLEEDMWELDWVHFCGLSSKEYYELFRQQMKPVFRPMSNSKLISYLQDIYGVCSHLDGNSEILASNLITGLLTTLLTMHRVENDEDTILKEKLKSVLDYIDRNFCNELTLDALADQFFISKYYLVREFKKIYGETIFQHIISLRIAYAKRLLRFTDRSVEEISVLCGFHDQSYFTKQFKKAESQTCLAYRKQWRD